MEYQEASSYLCGFAWKKEEANVENFEGVLAQMTVIGYLVETGCAYLMDEEGDYYQWACPKEAI